MMFNPFRDFEVGTICASRPGTTSPLSRILSLDCSPADVLATSHPSRGDVDRASICHKGSRIFKHWSPKLHLSFFPSAGRSVARLSSGELAHRPQRGHKRYIVYVLYERH